MKKESLEPEDLKVRIKKFSESNVFTSVKVSDEIQQSEEDLSPRFLEALSQLTPGQYSDPQLQTKSETPSYKILYLKDVTYDEVPPFSVVNSRLKGELMGKISERESIEYKKRLRKRFPVSTRDELLSNHFEPFVLEVDGKKIDIPLPNV